jgi:hypothetical protein
MNWYDIALVALAAAIVYPDKVLEWLSERTGCAFGWFHVVVLEVVAIALMGVTMLGLMPMYPKLEWWHPVMYVGMLASIRVITGCVTRLFGLND